MARKLTSCDRRQPVPDTVGVVRHVVLETHTFVLQHIEKAEADVGQKRADAHETVLIGARHRAVARCSRRSSCSLALHDVSVTAAANGPFSVSLRGLDEMWCAHDHCKESRVNTLGGGGG